MTPSGVGIAMAVLVGRSVKAGPDAPPLAPLYVAGEVRRWHANPAMAREGQTNADHQGRCVQLLLMLNPTASPALIRAMVFHDVGELFAGDLSSDFKRAHPAVAHAHALVETAARERLCGVDPWLTEEERRWLKLVDRLEASAFVIFRNPAEAMRAASGWPKALRGLVDQATALGVGAQVSALIDDLFGGDW